MQGLIDEGILVPSGAQPDDWEFHGNSLARARIAIRLMRDLELNLAGTAIVLDLLAEIELLRSHPQRD
ncbi:MAG: chaperone modulator CbpM [Steroidobacteraceae bacterium]